MSSWCFSQRAGPTTSTGDPLNHLPIIADSRSVETRPGFVSEVGELLGSIRAARRSLQVSNMADHHDDLKVSFVPSIDLTKADVGAEFDVLVRVTPPAGTTRTVSNIACVLDISGSMGAEATIQSASGKQESHGLSLLDVAKHGVKAVVKSLNQNDYFCLVLFNHQAEMRIPLTQMTEENKAKALEELDKITQGGGTNMWTGIELGLDQLKAADTLNSLSHMICLTDGATNDRSVLLPNIKAYGNGRLPATISTFGFGYAVESDLLTQVASEGSGTYSFIPDAGFVGTAFVNLMSYLVVTNAVGVYLDIAPEDNVEPAASPEVMGGMEFGNLSFTWESASKCRVKVGTMQFGQAKDVVLKMKVKKEIKSDDPYLTANVIYELPGKLQAQSGLAKGLPLSPLDSASVATLCEQRARCAFVTTVQAATKDMLSNPNNAELLTQKASDVTELATLVNTELTKAGGSSEFLEGLLADVQGQVAEAFSKTEFYTKWGRHYLPSLVFAHKLQMCNNFKDPGVQNYGGDLFIENQELADKAFNELDPPKPSINRSSYFGGSTYSAPVASMATYNDRYAG